MKTAFSKRNRTTRSAKGLVAAEIAIAGLIAIGVVALALNINFAMMSYGTNARACRDAARAAAQGSSQQEATQLANTIVKTFNSTNNLLSPITVTNVTYTDFGGSPAPGVCPFVTVTTKSSATMPVPIEFFGKDVFATVIPVQKTYTFPIVRLTVNP